MFFFLKDYGEIPGGANHLKPLLYPFFTQYPLKAWSKYRWWKNSNLSTTMSLLNGKKSWITVIDRLGAPGDALISANIIHCIKKKYPQLRVNFITPHPELVRLDPAIEKINKPETFYSLDSSYWELIVRKEKKTNVVKFNLEKIGLNTFEYNSKYYASEEELDWANSKLSNFTKPLLAICTKSKECVKNWSLGNWEQLINKLSSDYCIIQLGDKSEPTFTKVERYAGKCTMRQSAALLAKTILFVGPDSLLMHIANGLKIPSVIIFGGSRPVSCFGYLDNENLVNSPPCSPCWIHDGYEICNNDLICMKNISVEMVYSSIIKKIKTQ